MSGLLCLLTSKKPGTAMLKSILSEEARRNDLKERAAEAAERSPKAPLDPSKHAYLFQPGNPGKQKGTKHKIADKFVKDLHDAWVANGPAVIERVIQENPAKFLDIIARIVPRELTIRTETSDVNDEQLGLFLDTARRAIENRAISSGRTSEETGRIQTLELQAIPKAE